MVFNLHAMHKHILALSRNDQQNYGGKVKIIIFRFAIYSVPCLVSLAGLKTRVE